VNRESHEPHERIALSAWRHALGLRRTLQSRCFPLRPDRLAAGRLGSAIAQPHRGRRRFKNAEHAQVGAEERGGEFSLRPSRAPWRPRRLIRLSGTLVVASPRCGWALNSGRLGTAKGRGPRNAKSKKKNSIAAVDYLRGSASQAPRSDAAGRRAKLRPVNSQHALPRANQRGLGHCMIVPIPPTGLSAPPRSWARLKPGRDLPLPGPARPTHPITQPFQ
jgi:hypothetical protein